MFHRKFRGEDLQFVSDTHRSHKNICRATSNWESGFRDFDSIEEMDKAIDDSFKPGKILFHLGDTIFGDKTKLPEWIKYLRTLYEEIHLIYGNHDIFIRKNKDYQNLFASCSSYLEISVDKKLVCLQHHPIRSWTEMHRGSYHLYGHCHGSIPDLGKSMDVGWDVWKRPLSFTEIDGMLSDRKIVLVDHHGR